MAIRESEVELALNMVSLGGLQDQGVRRVRKRQDAGDRREASHDTLAGQFVRTMLGTLSDLAATTAIAQDISDADINVLRSDVLNACVIPTTNGPKIIIFSGLIRAFMFMLEFGKLIDVINHHRNKLMEVCRLEAGDLESTGYQAFTLLGHYAIWGTPLPRAYPTIGKSERSGLILDLSKVLWFLVMHELAHTKLGHLDSMPAGIGDGHVLPALALDEGQNGLKLREFEADEYIIESLAPSVRNTLLSWVLLPLQMFCSLERLLTNYRSTHPMAINRLNHLRSKAEGTGDDRFAAVVEDIVIKQIEAQRAYMESTRNMAFHSSYDTAWDALFRLQQYAAYARGLDTPETASGTGERGGVWDALTDHFGNDDD